MGDWGLGAICLGVVRVWVCVTIACNKRLGGRRKARAVGPLVTCAPDPAQYGRETKKRSSDDDRM